MGEYLIHRARVRQPDRRQHAAGEAVDRLGLGRGPGLLPRRRLPPVQRHPQQPHHALRARPYRPRRARSASTASPATTPTATPATCRAGWSPASMAAGASRAPSSTARVTTLVDSWNGKRLNSPNDVVVKSDGTIWFTDPSYGILTDLEGWQGELEYGACHVFCFDPATGELRVVGRRLRQAQRHRLLARREDPLHRRHRRLPRPGRPAPHPRLRRHRQGQAEEEPRLRHLRRRPVRRLPPRHRRPRLEQRRRRRPLLRPRRRPARQDPGARGGQQRLLRRAEEEPALHLRHDQPVRGADARERGAEAVDIPIQASGRILLGA